MESLAIFINFNADELIIVPNVGLIIRWWAERAALGDGRESRESDGNREPGSPGICVCSARGSRSRPVTSLGP